MNESFRPSRRFTAKSQVALTSVVCALAVSSMCVAQGRGESRSGAGSPGRSAAPQRGVVHARRDAVRTDSAPRPAERFSAAPAAPVRQQFNANAGSQPRDRAAFSGAAVSGRTGVVADRAFTRTAAGRRYDNGMVLRRGTRVTADWQRGYFPGGTYHYPYYSQAYDPSLVFISPYGFYFGICSPFILRDHCYNNPPFAVYIDIPLYSGDNCRGYGPIGAADNYLDLGDLRDREPGLANAVDELREAFGRGNIDSLVALTEPNMKIAIFLQGKYDYSLDSSDFVDMTRDAIQSTQTIEFDLTRIHERAAGVYVVSGKHVYSDKSGRSRTVYVSYVLEDISGVWTLTQVGTAPDRVQEW